MPKRSGRYVRAPAAKRSRALGVMRRSVFGRVPRAMRAPPPFRRRVSLNYHEFTRYGSATNITAAGTTEELTYNWSLTDVLSYTEFTAMFDQYKIKRVDFKIQMITNPDAIIDVNGTDSTYNQRNNFFPKLWYIRDYDGGGAESLSSIKERVGVKFFVMRPNKEYTIAVKPKVLLQTYKTLTATGYSPKSCWVDCVDNSVPHYGLNAVIDNLGFDPVATSGFRFRIEYKFHLAFKGVR